MKKTILMAVLLITISANYLFADWFKEFKENYDAENYTKAFSIALQAAENDDLLAMCQVGVLYYEGLGVDKNYESAIMWTQKAADKGNLDAIDYLSEIEKDEEKAMFYAAKIRFAAYNGDQTAISIFKKKYGHGLPTVSNDLLAGEKLRVKNYSFFRDIIRTTQFITPNNMYMFSDSNNYTKNNYFDIRIFDIKTGGIFASILDSYILGTSPDKKYVVIRNIAKKLISVLDTSTFKTIHVIKNEDFYNQAKSSDIAISPDGKKISYGIFDEETFALTKINEYDLKSGKITKSRDIKEMFRPNIQKYFRNFQYSPNGKFLMGRLEGTNWLICEKDCVIFKQSPRVYSLISISPNSKLIAFTNDGKISLYNIITKKIEKSFDKRFDPKNTHFGYSAVAFSPNGKYLTDGVKIWNVASGEIIKTIESERTDIKIVHVVFTNDGKNLFVYSSENKMLHFSIFDVAELE